MNYRPVVYSILAAGIVFLNGCKNQSGSGKSSETGIQSALIINNLNEQLSEAIILDGFSPPVASRNYAYPNIAAYEVIALSDNNLLTLAGQLNDLQPLVLKTSLENFDPRIAMITAFSKMAVKLVYRDYIIEKEQQRLLDELKREVKEDVFQQSVAIGTEVSDWIGKWAASDKFKETRNYPRYEVLNQPGTWVPTPPKYGEAIEPHWSKVRPFALDSSSQFTIFPPPYPFSTDSNSDFYKMAMEVYDSVKIADDEKIGIAKHWDCNPAPSENKGHLMGLRRQISPGGHWMGITGQALRNHNITDASKCVEAYTRVSIALADAFKSCWDEKYKSNLIRPETYINKYIDANFKPLLETPMFPEHTSGHSVISNAAATVLTDLMGDHFAFIDSVEIPFGNPPRSFNSFYHAAKEATMSRVYGGIHYMPACSLGMQQGKAVGGYIVQHLKTRKD